jgi:hypothetical protein
LELTPEEKQRIRVKEKRKQAEEVYRDVALPHGEYVLSFNNQFSLLTDKSVSAEINATYEELR